MRTGLENIDYEHEHEHENREEIINETGNPSSKRR